jgi:NADH-quinone oxidoreductase subunit L
LLLNKYYVDELYEGAIVSPMEKLSWVVLWRGIDTAVIDGLVNGSGKLVESLSGAARRIQTGVAQNYALIFVVGIIVVLGILVLR